MKKIKKVLIVATLLLLLVACSKKETEFSISNYENFLSSIDFSMTIKTADTGKARFYIRGIPGYVYENCVIELEYLYDCEVKEKPLEVVHDKKWMKIELDENGDFTLESDNRALGLSNDNRWYYFTYYEITGVNILDCSGTIREK